MALEEDKELEDGLVEADESELSERAISDELPEVVANSPKSSRNTKTVDQSYLEDSIKTPSRRKRPRGTEEISETPDHETKLDQSLVGSKIQVWWPGDKRDMSGKEKGKKVSGPAPVKLLDGIPVGELRDRLVEDITTHVSHCDHFSPCISWREHKKANRVNDLWDTLKHPWGLPECENTKKWFNNTARSRWSDFKTRKLKPFFDSAYPDLGKAIANRPENFIDAVTWEKLCKQFVVISDSGMDPDGKEDLHKYYDEAINTGSDESTANTNIVLKVFGRTTRLGRESSRPSKQRSKRPYSSNHKEIDALREQIAAEKKKREDLEHAFGSLLDHLRQRGFLPPDDHNESTDNHE